MNDPKEMPFLDHLEEMRWRIIWSLLAVGVGTVLGIVVTIRFDLITVLTAPLMSVVSDVAAGNPALLGLMSDEKLVFMSLTEPFFFVLKVGMLFGVVLASPVVMYQLWAFLAPALEERERRAIVPTFVLGSVLFGAGVAMAYFVALPTTVRFLLLFGSEWFTPALTAGYYMSMVLGLILAFGLAFEVPVVMLVLTAIGLVSSAFLRQKRRHAVVVMAIVASVVTPGDHFQVTILLLGPLMLLYELGIFLAARVEKRRTGTTGDGPSLTASLLGVAAAASYRWRAASS
ncbi:MAG: twin-arginine translocase subunit TatC [Gemmatimonadota bacterium]